MDADRFAKLQNVLPFYRHIQTERRLVENCLIPDYRMKRARKTLWAGLVLFIMKTYLRQGAVELPAADFRAG